MYVVARGDLLALLRIPCCSFSPTCLNLFVTIHAKDALRGARISEVLNLFLAVATLETVGAKGLVSSQNSQVLDLVLAAATAVCAIVTY